MIPMVRDLEMDKAHGEGRHEKPYFGCEACRARRGELLSDKAIVQKYVDDVFIAINEADSFVSDDAQPFIEQIESRFAVLLAHINLP